MRLRVPLTGTVKGFKPDEYELDGIGVYGDDDDPVRLVGIDLGDVHWTLVSINLEDDEAVIEVFPEELTMELKPGGDPNIGTDYIYRPSTEEEKQQKLDKAKAKIETGTKDELYALTGDKRLKKLQKHVDDFNRAKGAVPVWKRIGWWG